MRHKMMILVLAAVLATRGRLGAADVIAVESTAAPSGASGVPVRILADTAHRVMGFSFAGLIPAGLRLAELTLQGTDIDPDHSGAEFFMPVIQSDYFGAAVIMDYEAPYDGRTFGPGTNIHVCTARFDVPAGITARTEFPIHLRADLGAPAIRTVFTVDGQSLTPDLRDGTLTVEPSDTPLVFRVREGQSVSRRRSAFEILCSTDEALRGYSLCLRYPEEHLAVEDVTLEDTAAAGAAHTLWQASGGILTVGVVYSYSCDQGAIAPGIDLSILKVVARVTDTACAQGVTTIPLTLEDQPPAFNRVSLCDDRTADPRLEPGALQVRCDPVFLRGDCNADGRVDIGDPIKLLAYLFANDDPPLCHKAADANDDGVLNIADAIYSLSYQFAGGPPPPAPFPACGVDPTADDLPCDSFPPCE